VGTCIARPRRGSGNRSRVVIGNPRLYGGGTPEKFAERFASRGPPGVHPQGRPLRDRGQREGDVSDKTLAWLDETSPPPEGKGRDHALSWRCTSPRARTGSGPTEPGTDYEEWSGKLLPILNGTGVDAVGSGHEHMQHVEIGKGSLVLISGGAGAPLAPFQRYGYTGSTSRTAG